MTYSKLLINVMMFITGLSIGHVLAKVVELFS
jgi:hypothetical protein